MRPAMRTYLTQLTLTALAVWLALDRLGIAETRPLSPVIALLLLLLSLVAYQFPVRLSQDWKVHVASSPLLAGAYLFGPADAMALAFVAAFAGNALLRVPGLPRPVQRRPWWNWLLNAAQSALSVGLASLVYLLLAGNNALFEPTSVAALAGLLLAALVARFVGALAVARAVVLYQGGRGVLGVAWEACRTSWREELGLAMLAIVTALVAEDYPWAVLLQAGSLVVVYLSFQHGSRLRQQTRETVEHLAEAVDRRDPYTYQHSQNVSRYAVQMARRLGLPSSQVEVIRSAALVHDIGKIALRDAVLLKSSGLTASERTEIEQHPVAGADMVGRLPDYREGRDLILYHHEAWDGRGYPQGLAAEQIPLGARIIAIADSYDAMATDRPYRKALPTEEIVRELLRGRGRQWDPKLVDLWVAELETQHGQLAGLAPVIPLVARSA